jgi:hypothetical protein
LSYSHIAILHNIAVMSKLDFNKGINMVPARKLVTLDELSALLTSELQKIPDAAGSKITVQFRLREPDADGCNWSDTDIVVSHGPNALHKNLAPHVQQLVKDARERFNIQDEA